MTPTVKMLAIQRASRDIKETNCIVIINPIIKKSVSIGKKKFTQLNNARACANIVCIVFILLVSLAETLGASPIIKEATEYANVTSALKIILKKLVPI